MNLPPVPDPAALLVLTSCPGEPVALDIARILVDEGLAACVHQLGAGMSVYRWEGRVCEQSERLLVIKTTRARYEALEMRLRALHPYEIPEIIAVPVVLGSGPYLSWLAAATADVTADKPSPSVHSP